MVPAASKIKAAVGHASRDANSTASGIVTPNGTAFFKAAIPLRYRAKVTMALMELNPHCATVAEA
jgi:hypothetical protein